MVTDCELSVLSFNSSISKAVGGVILLSQASLGCTPRTFPEEIQFQQKF